MLAPYLRAPVRVFPTATRPPTALSFDMQSHLKCVTKGMLSRFAITSTTVSAIACSVMC